MFNPKKDDIERIKSDWQLAKNAVFKHDHLFTVPKDDLEALFYHCALLMMSYSFTDPEEEEDGDMFTEDKVKSDPIRFMLPVGDLLNHTFEHNAHIEFE